jgi:hypothetical protein
MAFETTRYGNLRANVSPELAGLSDLRLAEALAARNIDAEAMEGFLDDLGRFAARAAPTILPVAGRVIGSIYGGPAGAAVGGALGSLAGGAITTATGGARPATPAAPVTPSAPTPIVGGIGPTTPAPVIAPGAGSPAASQLLSTITRPETLAALASMALGASGRSDIPVGGTSVPVSAFSNLISMLAGRAEAEYGESIARAESAAPAYMRGASGETRGDPAIEEHRASALYEFLHENSETEWSEYAESDGETCEHAESEWESEADAFEMLELAHELAESEAG